MLDDDRAAIEKWSLELQSCPTSISALRHRGAAYLQLGQSKDAEQDARTWLTLQPSSGLAFGLLGEALLQQAHNDDAVKAFKHAVALDANDASLQNGLHRARVAVLDALAEDDTVPAFQPTAIPVIVVSASTQPATTPPSAPTYPVSSAMQSNDDTASTQPSASFTTQIVATPPTTLFTPVSPKSVVVALLLDILNNLSSASPQLLQSSLCFAVGVAAWCMHRVRVLSVVVGLATALILVPTCRRCIMDFFTRRLTRWLAKSSNKLYDVALLPCILMLLPTLLRLIGLVNLFSFIHNDLSLACGVVLYLTTALFLTREMHPKLVKAGLHVIVVLYWVVLMGHTPDLFRFIPPVALELAGYCLESISPGAVHDATKRALAKHVAAASSQLNVWGLLALGHWAIDFWNQPSTLSVDDIVSTFQTFQTSAVELFQAEILAHRRRTGAIDPGDRDEYAILVAYVAKTVRDLPPPRAVAILVVLVRRCGHMVVFAWLVVFGGKVCFALVPLMVLELDELRMVRRMCQQEAGDTSDTLDMIGMTSPPLLAVWSNLKAGAYCLECSVIATQTVTAASSAASLASKLSGLATTVVSVRRDGLAPHVESMLDATLSLYESRHLVRPILKAWAGVLAFWQRRS
ncbi:hypothetical protein, variant 1 [Aphanomyces invadans]|uniref:Uncharacterized protein n=2 Tax=Aphanomyces invadans TaxID=157072 RepID=A0A024UKR9_9STRA|nr:hypothetical protein, variant 1 [Aphanomyces invadans]ETW06417.1 hypothetical protein, variant 1 [Aphanomyces invadans]|eukprot:XP_008864492.1 hypothetical protein, variant 1 [Aphanomyces invadans]